VRVVLDPNVLVSAAISPGGAPREIINAWTSERFELIASPALLDELADVLARPKFQRFITTAVAVTFVDGLATDATILTDPPDPPTVSRDRDDDYLIALARTAGADYLVAGGRDLLDLPDPDPLVLTPRQFLDILNTRS
jgi:putative PIN family toxin of toxin-antitoxin system